MKRSKDLPAAGNPLTCDVRLLREVYFPQLGRPVSQGRALEQHGCFRVQQGRQREGLVFAFMCQSLGRRNAHKASSHAHTHPTPVPLFIFPLQGFDSTL